MKKTLVAAVMILGFTNLIIAQDRSSEIKNTFESYRTYVEKKDYDKAFDYYLDSFLVYVPKEALIKQIASLYDNERIEYSVTNSHIVHLSEVLQKDNKNYALLKYGAYYHYQFKEKADKEFVEQIQNKFKAEYDTNYSYSKKERKITFYKEQELLTIQDDTQCKFIPFKEKLKPYLSLWIPQETLVQLLLLKTLEKK